MSREIYVNGRYLPHNKAQVHVEDRGYQFADGIYEVVPVVGGVLVDEDPHLDRLDRSLKELQISEAMSRGALKTVVREIARRNSVRDGIIYIQITRGVAHRDHVFPAAAKPAVVVYARRKNIGAIYEKAAKGVAVITTPDLRWKRCDIKTVSLLPNVLAKQEAAVSGAYEAWQIDADGMVTEGTSSNAWIVTHKDDLITRPPTDEILNGITRQTLISLAEQNGLTHVSRSFTVEEALGAREAFASSATSFVMPVVSIDGKPVGDGKPGPLCKVLLTHYQEYIEKLKASGSTLDASLEPPRAYRRDKNHENDKSSRTESADAVAA